MSDLMVDVVECACMDTDCLACFPTLYTGHYEGPGDCATCGDEEQEHEHGVYCYPTRGLCPCGCGNTPSRCDGLDDGHRCEPGECSPHCNVVQSEADHAR